MKKLGLVILLIGITHDALCQNVGINTTGLAPNVSAMLDVESTNKGLLVPRITLLSNADATTIVTPATSLLIYNTATAGVVPNNIEPGYYYNSGTPASPLWQRLLSAVNTSSNAWLINGNSGTVSGTHFIGTTDNVPFNIKVNNMHSGHITSNGPVFLGYRAGITNIALYNTGIGYQSLFTNTSGNYNTAIGRSTLYLNTIGAGNTAVGVESLYSNVDGGSNTSIGYTSLYSNTSGSGNTATGVEVLYSNTTGFSNTGIGMSSLYSNTGGYNNSAVGNAALYTNTTGHDNSAMGDFSLFHTAIGHRAMYANTTGSYCAAYGNLALNDNTTGDYNTANGNEALNNNTTGNNNTASGYRSLYAATTGSFCSSHGTQSLNSNTTGSNNTANGYRALYANTTGSCNAADGYSSLSNNTTGSNNTGLGYQANVSAGNLTNATVIGNGATVNASNKIRLGNAAITVIEGQVTYTFPSDARFKENVKEDILGLNFILKLRPVSYNFNRLSFAQHIKEHTEGRETELIALSKNRSSGFLAQDIEQLVNDLGFESFDAIHKPTNETDNYSLSYSHFVIPLVKAVQEQQEIITQQNTLIDSLIKRLELLEKKTSHPNKE